MLRRPIDPALHPEVPGPGRPAPPGYEFAGFRRFELVLRQLGGIASRRELLAATDGDETSFWFALHYGYLDRVRTGWYAAATRIALRERGSPSRSKQRSGRRGGAPQLTSDRARAGSWRAG